MQHTRRLSLCELGEHSLENQQKICQKHVQQGEGKEEWRSDKGEEVVRGAGETALTFKVAASELK